MAIDTPIIVKRIKKQAAGHHGGSWKVAYADFVTAMMAFFLLLWLLNVTTPDQKKGIADYFTPTIGIKDGKGIGVRGGRSPTSIKGTSKSDMHAPGLVAGQVQQGPVAKDPDEAKHPDSSAESSATGSKEKAGNKDEKQSSSDTLDSDQFKISGEEVKQALAEDPDIKQFRNNVEVNETPEGLKIEMIDDEKQPMFIAGGATLTEDGKKILDSMASIIVKTPNAITIVGHTDAAGSRANPKYSNWELSADRANAARRALVATQLEPERVIRVIGASDKELLVKDEPANPRNRRVTILVMRGIYFQAHKTTGEGFLSLPDSKPKEPEVPAAAPAAAKPAAPSIFDQPPGR